MRILTYDRPERAREVPWGRPLLPVSCPAVPPEAGVRFLADWDRLLGEV